MTPIETIQAFHRQEVTFIQLLRAIITYESWHFPTRNDQPLLALHQEQQLLLLFSSEENFSSQNTDEVQPTVQTGAWLNHQLSTNIDSIVIDTNAFFLSPGACVRKQALGRIITIGRPFFASIRNFL